MPAFEIFPAVDLQGGRVAWMAGGDPSSLRTQEGDPVEIAASFVRGGARWIHLVDLDAALTGEPRNLNLLERIAALPVRVQAGGGLTPEAVRRALDRGANRAIVGTGSLDDGEAVESLVAGLGDRVGVGLDVRAGRVWPRGRAGPLDAMLDDVLAWLRTLQPAFVVYADVERDGLMAGPDPGALMTVAERTGVPVVASGGVRSLDDLAALAGLAPRVAGAIVGRALHDAAFTLQEALLAVG